MTDATGRIVLDGVAIDHLDRPGFLARVADGIASHHGGLIITPNLDHLRRTRRDRTWRDLLAKADLVVADGTPLLWAARLRGTPLPERLAGSDLLWDLCALAAERGFSVFLLGGAPGAATQAAAVLTRRYPALRLVGCAAPSVDDQGRINDADATRAQLAATQPDLLLIGLGSPKQELLAQHLRTTLPSTWSIGIGVSFSFVDGSIRRAPLWMQRCGLEWMHRLVQEPRRLAGRYLVHGLPYAARLLLLCLWQRFSRAR